MTPEDFMARGVALAERTHREVDVDVRMELLVGTSRRRRTTTYVLAAAAVVAAIVGISTLVAITGDAPPATEPTVPSLTAAPSTTSAPPTTVLESSPGSTRDVGGVQSLPVEVWVVLLGGYTVDAATGECSGTGELAGLLPGSAVLFVDETTGEELKSVPLPTGTEVRSGEGPLFLLPIGIDGGCVFELGDPGVTEFDIRFESDPDVGMSGTESGQRVVVRLEG
jgi:hypothetical protein